MSRLAFRAACGAVAVGFWLTSLAPAADAPLDAKRVEALAAMLPAAPKGVGPTIADRAAWQAAAAHPLFKNVVADARRALGQPVPELTDDVYLDFSRTGNRVRGQKVLSARHGRIPMFVLAECLENQGKFLPAIEAAIRDECGEKSWTLPAHDRSLKNFRGTERDIDLVVANEAWSLATADYWLGDKLSPACRQLLREQLQLRVFAPLESYVERGRPKMFWPTTTNNWNAVCLAGVTGAALATIEPAQRRAWYAAAAEKYIGNFLNGFTPDGYCSEGVGYWNYGFGHFALLAETLCQATGGKLDLLADPRVRPIALFGRRLEILPGIYPAFADCHVGAQPDAITTAFVLRRLGVPLRPPEADKLLLGMGPSKRLFELGLLGFANSASQRPAPSQPAQAAPLRDYFADAGILICRSPGAPFGAALKGGHNAEHHNHNDVGSFVVAVGKSTPLLDPGAEVYTARTFSDRRYDSNLLNSFGHPVPRVAGQLQRTGRAAAAKILRTDFGDTTDTLAMDIRSAYAVPSLQKLVRTFVFDRAGAGSLKVVDEVEFDAPQEFETALITFAAWKQAGPQRLTVGDGADGVSVDIDAGDAPLRVAAEEIKEDVGGHSHPVRLGIALAKPVTSARITLTIRPLPPAGGTSAP